MAHLYPEMMRGMEPAAIARKPAVRSVAASFMLAWLLLTHVVVAPGEAAFLWSAVITRDGETLSVDQVIEGTLSSDDAVLEGRGFAKRYILDPNMAGTVTLTVDSYDFDARIAVLDADGEPMAEEDGGGIDSNARLVFEAQHGRGHSIAVTSSDGRSGQFRLVARGGDVPAPTGARAAEIQSNFYREYARRRLELVETDPDPRPHRDRALQFLLASGNIDRQLGRFEYARSSLEKACELAEALEDRERAIMAGSLLGAVLRRAGDTEEAIRQLEPLLDDVRASPGLLQLRYLALDELGNAYLEDNREESLERASASFEELLGLAERDKNRALAANAHMGIARVEERRGDLAAVREQHRLAVAASRDAGDMENLAVGLRTIGDYYFRQSDYSEARANYEEALAMIGVGLGRARIAGALANVHVRSGRYGEAAKWYEECLVAARIAGNAAVERSALFGIANMRLRLGHQVEARERLRALLERARSESAAPAERAKILSTLSDALRDLGDAEGAERCLRQALVLSRDSSDRGGEAFALINLGLLQQTLGKDDEARTLWDEALRVAEEAEEAELRTRALANLTYLDLAAGDWDRASRNALEAVESYRRRGLEASIGSPLLVAAKVALQWGRLGEAGAHLEEAKRLLDRPDLRTLGSFESSAVRAGSWDWSQVAHDLTAKLVVAASEDPAARNAIIERGFSDAGLFKARGLLEGIAEHRAGRRSAETVRIRRAQKDATARRDAVLRELGAAVRATADSEFVDALRDESEALSLQVASLREELGRVSPRDASVEVPVGVEPSVLRKSVLAEGDLLIDYVAGEERLYAFVVSKDRSDFIDLGEWTSIREDLRVFMSRITRPTSLGDTETISRYGKALFDRLLRPAIPVVPEGAPGVKRLVIVPNTGLSELSFEALVVDAGEGRGRAGFDRMTFVLDRYEVVYSPSSPVLAFLAGVAPRGEGGRMLMLADPVYGSEGRRTEAAVDERADKIARNDDAPKGIAVLERLPGTREEALAIAERCLADYASPSGPGAMSESIASLRERRSGSLSVEELDVRLGRDANPAVLQGDLRDYAVLHFATHGVIDPRIPDHSGIVLSAAEGDSGFLSLTEVLDFDLDADLTVLSACQTARGRVTKGEGVQSLAAAFLFAGSRRVIASLWKVSDRETTQLMQELYRSMREDAADPATALRRAKLTLRKGFSDAPGSSGDVAMAERGFVRLDASGKPVGTSVPSAHPYFWAPFIYVGCP